jgi:HEAT repeat protein
MCDEFEARSLIGQMHRSETHQLQIIAHDLLNCHSIAVVPIMETLHGDDSRIKPYLIWALSQLVDQGVFVQELVSLLPLERGYTRKYIIESLLRFTTPIVIEALIPAFIADLGDSYFSQKLATEKLPTYGNLAVEPLIKALKERFPYQSEHYDKRLSYIVLILGKIRDTRAIEPLVEALQFVRHKDAALSISISLEAFGRPVVPLLIDLIKNPETHPFSLSCAISTLLRLPTNNEVVETLINLLTEDRGDLPTKQSAVFVLAQSGDTRAFEPIRDILLHNSEEYLRVPAATALGTLPHIQAEDSLILALQTDTSKDVRRAVISALRFYASDRVVQALINALFDEDEGIPNSARYALDFMIDQARPALKKIHAETPHIIDRAYTIWPWEWVNASRNKLYRIFDEVGLEEAKTSYLDQAKDCPICATSANELTWFPFATPPETWEKLVGRGGWISVCDKCNIQVDFFMTIMN